MSQSATNCLIVTTHARINREPSLTCCQHWILMSDKVITVELIKFSLIITHHITLQDSLQMLQKY